MAKIPKTSKGRKRLYEVSIVAWFDLLGYGTMLEKANFDPTQKSAWDALVRLDNFQKFVATHANKYFPIHAINDGVIIYKDLSPRSNSVTFAFLDRAISLFKKYNEFDKSNGFPGARMVIATGFRVRIKEEISPIQERIIENLKKRLKAKLITSNQAIDEAYHSHPHFGLIPQIQANFAFTKAYLVDNLGSKGGFGGANCYIDTAIFDLSKVRGIEFTQIIQWQQLGMSSNFGLLKAFDREVANKNQHVGLLDAFQVAENISSEENVTNLLREKTIRKTPLKYK